MIDRSILDETGALSAEVAGDALILHPTRLAKRIWMSPDKIHQPIVLRRNPVKLVKAP